MLLVTILIGFSQEDQEQKTQHKVQTESELSERTLVKETKRQMAGPFWAVPL